MIEKIKIWHKGLAARERNLVLSAAIIVLILLAYLLIFQPFYSALNTARTDVNNKKDTVAWMQHAAIRLQALRISGIVRKNLGNESLLSFIDGSLRENNLSGYNPQLRQTTNQEVNLNFAEVPFDNLITWLTSIWQEYGIYVVSATISPASKTGTTKIDINLNI